MCPGPPRLPELPLCLLLLPLLVVSAVPNSAVLYQGPKKNITVGYLTAIKGELKDRQGLTVSGAITLALEEVSVPPYPLPLLRGQMRVLVDLSLTLASSTNPVICDK
uniref:Uncharacterized protein n=1 Tax=Timema monikensis TaxID=170555 RepID=A0A7R9HP15_9NEOP|nr:unnamed protein product [Timema monikensis]